MERRSPISGPRLSLVMVVCNEEARLPNMLADTRPHVDEVVVVVQQSQDGTLELPEQWQTW